MKLPHRRQFLHVAAGAAALPAVSRIATAQTYPTRPVRIIVGLPAGLATDILARLVGQSLSERLGKQFIVENRPGAGGNLATEAVVRAPADGYTLLQVNSGNAVNASLYANLNFNFIRDITPVACVARTPFVMVVNPSSPAKTVPEFIAYAKANPGKINMASPGIGSANHIFGASFAMMAGIDLVHVPYRGDFMADLLGGGGAGRVQCNGSVYRVHQRRQAARPRSDLRGPLGCAARHPSHGRICDRLRGERLARYWRPEKYAHQHC